MSPATPTPAVWLRRGAMLLFLGTLVAAPLVAGTFDPLAQAAVTGAVLTAAILHRVGRRLAGAPERVATPVDIPLALLLGAALASLLFSVNRHASVVEFLRLLSCVAAFRLAVEAVHGSAGVWKRGGDEVAAEDARSGQPDVAAAKSTRPVRESPRKRKRHAAPRAALPVPGRGEGAASAALRIVDVLDRPAALLWGALVAGSAWGAARGVQEYLAALREGFSAWRVFGGFSHPSTLIAHLGLTLPLMLAAALALRARQDPLRAAWPVPALVSLLTLAAAAFTASRLGTLALGLGILLFVVAYLFARRSVTPLQAAGIAIALVALGVATVLLVPTLRARVDAALSGSESFSLLFRFTTWQAAWRIFLSHPLVGSGIGTFSSIMTRYSATSYSQTAHNHFVQTAAETGVVGIGALLALLGLWLAAVARGIRGRGAKHTVGSGGLNGSEGADERATAQAAFLAAALGGVAASAAFAFVDFGWSIPATGLALWTLMGAGLAAAGGVSRQPARPGVEVAALLLLCVALVADGPVLLGSLHYVRGVARRNASFKAAAAGDLQQATAFRAEATDEWGASLRVDPYFPEAHLELGRLDGGVGLASGDRTRVEEGMRHLEEAVRLAPTVALHAYHLGLLAMRAGDSERAAAAFRRALEWDPNSPPTWRKYGLLCERWRPAETLKAARRLVAAEAGPYGTIYPLGQRVEVSYAFGHHWLGEEKRRTGDHAGARAEDEKALAILERYRESLKGIGGIGPDGETQAEVDPDCPPLEAAVRRGLAETM